MASCGHAGSDQMQCNHFLGWRGERGRAGANEAAALKECDRLTESLPKIDCGAAEHLVELGGCVQMWQMRLSLFCVALLIH